MRPHRVLRGGAIALLVCVALGAVAVSAILWDTHRSVLKHCAAAQRSHPHPGDDVSALIGLMSADARPLRERNLAVWTLGRLSDARALPALAAAYTGEPCDHDRSLCQYELMKAIVRCGGDPDSLARARR